ncbi:hypothetical protein D4764_02G0007700 [Takifugu flavidus]|uniref:Uncharacterized protein n=1 Tax=Takifugu flavidus TaxID=433684 RepID=A0A5C6NM28_9TELE|nr:hypothetical protein D4764_02G0007700 [Takifugu flavidus]
MEREKERGRKEGIEGLKCSCSPTDHESAGRKQSHINFQVLDQYELEISSSWCHTSSTLVPPTKRQF